MKNHFCTICNKKYASYQSLWNHNKKFHKTTDLINNNISPNVISISPNVISISPNVISISPSIEKLQCIYCNKVFKHRSNKSVHIKTCKKRDLYSQNINNRINCIFCGYISKCVSSFYKHRKICKKKQEQITIINNNIINNNNNSINNSYNNNTINNKYIVNFSDNQDFFKLLSQEQKVQIIEQCRLSFTKMISLTHFNDDYPELQNIYFVNLKDDIGYVFEDSRFIAINKSEVLNETYNNKIDLIYEILNDTSIDNKFKKNFEKFYLQLQDTNSKYQHQDKKYDNLKDFIIEQMNFIIYNNSNKKLFEKLKKSETLKKITLNEFFNNVENKRNNAINDKIK